MKRDLIIIGGVLIGGAIGICSGLIPAPGLPPIQVTAVDTFSVGVGAVVAVPAAIIIGNALAFLGKAFRL